MSQETSTKYWDSGEGFRSQRGKRTYLIGKLPGRHGIILKSHKENEGIQLRGKECLHFGLELWVWSVPVPWSAKQEGKRDPKTVTESHTRARYKQKIPNQRHSKGLSREEKTGWGGGLHLGHQGSSCRFRKGQVEMGTLGLCNTFGFTVAWDIVTCRAGAENTGDRSVVAEAQDTQGSEEIGLSRGSVSQGIGLDW